MSYRNLEKTYPRIRKSRSNEKFEEISQVAREEYNKNLSPQESYEYSFIEAQKRLMFLFERCGVYENILRKLSKYLTEDQIKELSSDERFDYLISFLDSYVNTCKAVVKVSSLYPPGSLTETDMEVLELMKNMTYEEKRLAVDMVKEIKCQKWADKRNHILHKARLVKKLRRGKF